MRLICRICTAMHSNAHPTTAHLRSSPTAPHACARAHISVHDITAQHGAGRGGTAQHSTPRTAHLQRSAPCCPALRMPRRAQGVKGSDRAKLSCGFSPLFVSLRVWRPQAAHLACCTCSQTRGAQTNMLASVTCVSWHDGAHDTRRGVLVGRAPAQCAHTAISSHSARESSSCTPGT